MRSTGHRHPPHDKLVYESKNAAEAKGHTTGTRGRKEGKIMNEFYAADLHINHRKVANIRGYATPDLWNKALIEKWNATVRLGDRVWVLGDVAMGDFRDAWPILAHLGGELHLVTGNHDAVFPGHRDSFKFQAEWMTRFQSVQPFTRRRLEGRNVMASHFPYEGDSSPADRYTEFRLRDEGLPVIHGHTHSTEKVSRSVKGTLQICVSMDAWELKPAPLADIMRLLRDDATHATTANRPTVHPIMLEGGIPR
jgi:calcineurin-like phosphoesterase family protein